MMFFSTAFVFLLIQVAGSRIGLVSGQPPTPCCAPDQFTFRYDGVVSAQSGAGPMEITGQLIEAAYDFVDSLIGMEVVYLPVNKTEQKFKFIQNFTSGDAWIIEGSQCQKLPAAYPPSRCIPAGSVYEGTFGIGPEHLRVSTWMIKVNAGKIQGHQRYTVTDHMCAPFSSIALETEATTPPTTGVSSGNYMDFEAHIHDRARWFHLPPACQNATLMAAPAEYHRIPSIF